MLSEPTPGHMATMSMRAKLCLSLLYLNHIYSSPTQPRIVDVVQNFISQIIGMFSLFTVFVIKIFEDFTYLFLERGEGKEERERNINVWLPLKRRLLGTWPSIQACALTGNQTGNPLVRRPALNPLSHTSQSS